MIEIPGLGGTDQMQMLVIGQPSVDLLADLDNQRDLVYYRVKDAANLEGKFNIHSTLRGNKQFESPSGRDAIQYLAI